jgi:DNA-binding FadR family transcriptional regulator
MADANNMRFRAPALPRLADVVAEQIRDAILVGEIADGERLPPVDQLLTQFGVSAPSMREALRVLEAEGLISVQRGGIGGAIIRRPTAKTAAYTLALVLRSHGTRKSDVSAAAALLEPLCAGLCAQRKDRRSTVVPELRRRNKETRAQLTGDPLAFNDSMVAFHHTIVTTAGNDTMTLLTSALEHIWIADLRSKVRTTAAQGAYPSAHERESELRCHEDLATLIAAGDANGAEDLMRSHLAHSAAKHLVTFDEPVDPKSVRLSPATN